MQDTRLITIVGSKRKEHFVELAADIALRPRKRLLIFREPSLSGILVIRLILGMRERRHNPRGLIEQLAIHYTAGTPVN